MYVYKIYKYIRLISILISIIQNVLLTHQIKIHLCHLFFRLWIKFNHKTISCRDLRRALCISGWNTMDITGKRHLPNVLFSKHSSQYG